MQQIELSPAKFAPDEVAEQQEELDNKTELIANTVAIDEVTVLFFNPEGEPDIDPQDEFCAIIQRPIPPIKAAQIRTIERITYCFYSMYVEAKLQNLDSIQICFERYIEKTTFITKFVQFHEKIRRWCKQLFLTKCLTKSKQNLIAISTELRQSNEIRLQILKWKVCVCLILFDIIFLKLKIERSELIKLLKTFKTLKRENKISTRPVLNAFKFIIKYLIYTNNDFYIFFERELKIWCQQIVDNSLISEMKSLIEQCEQTSAKTLKSTTTNIFEQTTQVKSRCYKPNRKIVTNTLNAHLFKDSNPTILTSRRFIRRRLSKEKEDNFQKKVDHFLKIRENSLYRSMEATSRSSAKTHLKVSLKMSQKPSVSLHSINRFTLDQALVLKNALKTNAEEKKSQATFKDTSRVSLNASKSACSLFKRGEMRKRKQIYQKIVQKEGGRNMISNKHLMDEMFSLYEVQQQRCNITLAQILIGQFKKQQDDPNIKFVGASQDNQFGKLSLTFFTIFNQELASISFSIRKVSKLSYVLSCNIRSTYCQHPTLVRIKKKYNAHEFTLEDLNESIVNSDIYYEALQEKIESKISISELQAMEELLRQYQGVELSQEQLTKLLLTVDLLESEFFWYYTKSNYISGYRLERRVDIGFKDLSAFAVSLGKFKSDYDSCLSEIVLVQNTHSLVETCQYLSHGRMIVYKSLRKIKDIFYLEVISVSDKVYKSFSRKNKKPYFKNTQIQRTLLKVEQFTQLQTKEQESSEEQLDFNSMRHEIDLYKCLKNADIFIFFMKNIVENFIEIKYLRKIQPYLLKINMEENFQVFDQKLIKPFHRHSLEVITNNEQLCELKEFKPNLHSSIRHLREILINYCEVYGLDLSFTIVNKSSHLINIKGITYIVHEIALKNNLKILKICKRNKGQNYSLFFYHQAQAPLSILDTPFHSRFVMAQNNPYVGNLVRRLRPQMLLSDDCSTVAKVTIKYGTGYCFVNVSECQNIVCWRIDYYFPHKQVQYSTLLQQYVFLECLGQWGGDDQMWNETIKQIKIDLDKCCIIIHNRHVSLFRSIKKLFFYETSLKGSIELIEHEGQFSFLLTNFQQGTLNLGKVQNIMFLNNKSIFSSFSSSKQNIQMYDNIMNHLYYKLQSGKLPSQPIQTDYFISEKQ